MSNNSGSRSSGSDGRQLPPRPSTSAEQPDARRRCRMSGHLRQHHRHHHRHYHYHCNSAGFGQKHRQRDTKKCPRRRELSMPQHASKVLSREQGEMAVAEDEERAVALFSDDGGGLECLHGAVKKDGPWRAFKFESSDLDSRFWTDGRGQERLRANCSSTKAGESRRLVLSNGSEEFSSLPFDVLRRIAGSFSWPDLWAASRVCTEWSEALKPLRQAMLFVYWGKKLKHGRGGVARNREKALDSFLKGAVRGCAPAMVDAGLLLWEMGRREEGLHWYKEAAELGDPAGQCNLGLAYLQEASDPIEAAKWFHRAALAGHVSAQYSLALCLQQGRGLEQNLGRAARWYLRAAEGGNTRAMYNTALCFLSGEGLHRNYHDARKWMQRAAYEGHRKAQFEHGLTLFAEGDGRRALVFLELATRAGETAGTHIRDALLQQLSPKARANAITCADKWQSAKPMSHSYG